ncbi:hypothetical protein [Amycolatopsis sp. NBC_00438]|uniref:hypothetical protein n=1 Tax=Amycolatopsis sp. NBC_00438 TaxID=2903558 RepID=UPI002E1D1D2C
MTLEFPVVPPNAEQSDLPLEDLPPAAAPVLVPGTPPPAEPAPAPPAQDELRPYKRAAGVVGAVATVVAIVVVVAFTATTGRNTSATSSSTDATTPTTTTTPVETVSSTPDSRPTDESSARQRLDDQVGHDRGQVDLLTDSWVPQLSSKMLGLKANGTTYDHQAIWADFTSLQTKYPGVLLLWSGDYSSFKQGNFWVTVFPQPYSSGESANGWCDDAGIDKDGCYAKRITHTGGYTGSTMLRK